MKWFANKAAKGYRKRADWIEKHPYWFCGLFVASGVVRLAARKAAEERRKEELRAQSGMRYV